MSRSHTYHAKQATDCCSRQSRSRLGEFTLSEGLKASIENQISKLLEEKVPKVLEEYLRPNPDDCVAAAEVPPSPTPEQHLLGQGDEVGPTFDFNFDLMDDNQEGMLAEHSDPLGHISIPTLKVDNGLESTHQDGPASSSGYELSSSYFFSDDVNSGFANRPKTGEFHDRDGVWKSGGETQIWQLYIDQPNRIAAFFLTLHRPQDLKMNRAEDDFPMGGSEIGYSPPQQHGSQDPRPNQESDGEQQNISSEPRFWELMARTGPWMNQFSRQDLNWFITMIEDQRYDISCHLQDAATEDDGRVDGILQNMRAFLERLITALPPADEPNAGNTLNLMGASNQGSPLAAAAMSQHNSRVFSEIPGPIWGQSEPNLGTFLRSQTSNMPAMANGAGGSVASLAYNHSESGSVIVSPSKKRKTRHANGQANDEHESIHGDWQNAREQTPSCDCRRTTPKPLGNGSNAPRSQRPSPTIVQPLRQDRGEHAEKGMVPLPYRVYMCRGEPHLLMPVSKFKEASTQGGSDPVAVSNNSSSTTVYINSLRK
ncbi:hypothetical protein QBC41DRAFT_345045 [Cercophora samala]|uniref:Uncharacterized protein n=1 Tax=Cercophora samala TaxID=330535 RepID=A0AA40DBY3_9PEZI|nr:hypothetical protein QBC41DRAFT_345045 [Cercophora samala]